MLIELSVQNFRSIRERQTFSMVAAPRLIKGKQNKFTPKVKGERFPALLKVAAVYGPNASGKSTLVLAFDLLAKLAQQQPTTEKVPFNVAPFRFDRTLQDQPSIIEVHFIKNETRYSFEVALTRDRIVKEVLIMYKGGNARELYSRRYEPATNGSASAETYEFGDDLEGGIELHKIWQRLTGPQTLFLTQAVANSSEELTQLKVPREWLASLLVVKDGMEAWGRVSQRFVAMAPQFGGKIASLLSDVDIPVTAIRSKLSEPKGETEAEQSQDDAIESLLFGNTKATVHTTLTHSTALGDAEFDFSEESDGTKNLFGFSLPWLALLRRGTPMNLMVVDELDSSLHPKLVEALIHRHVQEEPLCQLLFTTHDTHLMDTKLLRRDQLWITDRDINGATQLRSIHDFEGRESEDVEKRYYEGRYRGLPFVRQ
jgi:AAA15 family ATPase/GTPase